MLPEFLVEESWTIGHQILPPFSSCNSLPRFLVPVVFDPFHVFDFFLAQLFFLCVPSSHPMLRNRSFRFALALAQTRIHCSQGHGSNSQLA